ncbi:hypothetical protein DC366_03395 [Pelagivirga sediminicola]|uniref:Uncharacterized protein n=1 Tax=Pelagivirga sediminicola TaxID=2170575 RepID=A0A2T7GC39_9RHOB|nr:hypothetical protein [Pelagivirga sediminicola]PVA11976.1 hypothetical protein DC366_03395 [Pelagivirga sediminicola]
MSGLTLLFAFMAAAFCVGTAVFYGIVARRTLRGAARGWLLCATLVVVLGWSGYMLNVAPNAAILTGLILPLWLMGGLLGLLIGAIRNRRRGP